MLIQNATNSTLPDSRVMNDVSVTPAVSTALPDSGSAPVAAAAPVQPSSAQLKDAVDSINMVMKQFNSELVFSVDDSTKQTIVRVVDTQTGDTIKQFPSEEVLAITRAVNQLQQGLLLSQKA